MIKKSPKRYYEFKGFKRFKGLPAGRQGLIHGVSTRKFGDCRKNLEKFLKTLGLKKENLVLAEQVHGNKIKVVREADRGKTISGVDGLISDTPGVILGVRTADCLPILFFEPEVKAIGVCHAGWRGILGRLPQKMIDLMILKGALPEKILVAIAPHICQNCYPVDKIRAEKFTGEFGQMPKMIYFKNKKYYLSLLVPTIRQLIHSGIRTGNIFDSEICNACKNNEFFSYRLNKSKDYGEMLSVIGLKA